MKSRLLIVLTFWMVAEESGAQNRANVWELGYSLNAPSCELRYINGSMDTAGVNRAMTFFITNTSICDTVGNLLFYSNGLTIGNANYDTLQNSIDFNPGWATDFNDPFGMSTCQGVLILPQPGNDDRYYVFHETGESFYAHGANQVQPLHLSYSVVDMNLDGGLGGIVDTLKNKYAIEDTLMWGGLTAVKHANGRDWWIITHQFYSDKYYKLLLTPEGLLGPYEQQIGSDSINDIDVQATFSPDGSKYCISSYSGWFDYMSFDRCTGDFSNVITVYNPSAIDHYFYGSSFSPNNRFIYASSTHNLYQYDTWSLNMVTDVIHVATWDSFYNPFFNIAVLFFMHQLAPDDKIYIGPFNGVEFLNVINSPDSLGTACNFAPHSYLLSHDCYGDVPPSFPNYDLGALEGSPCDTLNFPTHSTLESGIQISFSPNPVSTYLNIVYSIEKTATVTLTNSYGIAVKQLTLYPYFKNRIVHTDDLPSGVYLVTLWDGDTRISKRVVVLR